MFCRIMSFTGRNKATVTFDSGVTFISGCFMYNRATSGNGFSEKTCSNITANANKATRSNRFQRNFSNTRERISVKKVDEVLEAVLSTVGATRVPEIADLLVKIPSDVDVDVDVKTSSDERRGVVNLIDVLIADSIEIEGTVSLIGKLSMKRKMFK